MKEEKKAKERREKEENFRIEESNGERFCERKKKEKNEEKSKIIGRKSAIVRNYIGKEEIKFWK